MRKLTSLIALITFAALVFTPTSVLADPPSLGTASITATGSLGAVSTMSITILNDTDGIPGLTFASNGSDVTVTAPETVEVSFNDNTLGFQSVIVSTDNTTGTPQYTGLGTGSGLVAVNDTTVAAPLHWVIFPTQGEADPYVFTDFTSGIDIGKIDSTIQFFIVDRSDPNFDILDPLDPDYVLGFTTVLAGVTGQIASLANAPEDMNPTVDDDSDPGTPSATDGPQRQVANGLAYMKFAADYNGQPADDYESSTLTLDLVTLA